MANFTKREVERFIKSLPIEERIDLVLPDSSKGLFPFIDALGSVASWKYGAENLDFLRAIRSISIFNNEPARKVLKYFSRRKTESSTESFIDLWHFVGYLAAIFHTIVLALSRSGEISDTIRWVLVDHMGMLMVYLTAEERESIMGDMYQRKLKNEAKARRTDKHKVNTTKYEHEIDEEPLPQDQTQDDQEALWEAANDTVMSQEELQKEVAEIMKDQEQELSIQEEEVMKLVREYDRDFEPTEKEMNELSESIKSDTWNIYAVEDQPS